MNLYFSGIGDSQITPLAEIALDAGYNVSGSDKGFSALINRLNSRGVDIDIGSQDGSFLSKINSDSPIDFFINAAFYPEDHPEITKAKDLNIKIVSKDELVEYLVKEKGLKLIATAGSHGKTTITAMLIWVFKYLKIPISYYINASMNFGPSGNFDGSSKYFIYESDEYNKSFLSLKPYLGIITNIDYNHPETYPSISEYVDAYKDFVASCSEIVTWKNQHSEIYKNAKHAETLDDDEINSEIALLGSANKRNAALVQASLKKISIERGVIDALNSYPGISKRFEKLVENLYIDCGYHPVEVAEAISMAKSLNDQVVVVYQPYSKHLQNYLIGKYTDHFKEANKIYWLPTFPTHHENNGPNVNSDDLTKNITNKKDLQSAELNDDLWYNIEQDHCDGMLVICIGQGSLDGWLRGRLA